MPNRLTLIRHVASPIGMPYKLALIALAGCAAASIAYDANRGIAQTVADQVAQEESAFCLKLEMPQGARYEACLRAVARLVRRENEIRSVDF